MIVFIRQNLTSVDVRFGRIKTIPALEELKYLYYLLSGMTNGEARDRSRPIKHETLNQWGRFKYNIR